jgi:(S)-2-hydroxyglutarate dehydrogenase
VSRIGVIGAGIVGLAIARRLSSHADVTVLDKEDRVGAHQTGHNSGVAHAGLYYPPGSLKARLCRRGITLL